METVEVYSPIEDKNIKKDVKNSTIWKEAYHEDETTGILSKYPVFFKYSIKFNGLEPIQVTKVKRI